MISSKIIISLLLLSTSIIAYCLMNKKNQIPLKTLFGNPTTINPHISPQGTHLAYIKPHNNVLNVWVRTLGKEDDQVITQDTNKGVTNYFWCQDSESILYVQDKDGDENNHLYMTNIKTKETIDLTPYEGVKVQIMAHDKFNPDFIVVAMNKDDKTVHDVYKINIKTKETTLLQKNWGAVNGWEITRNLEVKSAQEAQEDGSYILKIKQDDGNWIESFHWGIEDSLNSGPSHFSPDGNNLYIIDSTDRNTGALIKYNLETKEKTLIAEHPQAEIRSSYIDSESLEVLAVNFYTDRGRWTFLDESIKEDFEIANKLHHGDISISSKSNDQQKWIIQFTQDTGPSVWYLYDRTTKAGTQLFYSIPELLKYDLQPMHPISFTARDGLEIHGYITYPANYKEKKCPLILNVHGGPWTRNSWGCNPSAQWMANRGYACLQINYRGSTGYGKDFVNAGDKEWSGKMHTDLIDGAEWAKTTGFIDESKIAIYGGSYGGYAALVGATFTPDYFTCAVDIVGMSNIITLLNSIPPYWKAAAYNFYKRVGHPERDKEYLESISPLFKVDEIKIPVLVAQGANDPRVKQAEAEQIVAAMKERNIPHQYLLFEDEGHGFAKPHNRLKFYSVTEKFFEEHLGN